jgi:hypothetical protein
MSSAKPKGSPRIPSSACALPRRSRPFLLSLAFKACAAGAADAEVADAEPLHASGTQPSPPSTSPLCWPTSTHAKAGRLAPALRMFDEMPEKKWSPGPRSSARCPGRAVATVRSAASPRCAPPAACPATPTHARLRLPRAQRTRVCSREGARCTRALCQAWRRCHALRRQHARHALRAPWRCRRCAGRRRTHGLAP